LADGPAWRESETGSAAFLLAATLAALAWANIGYAATWHTTLMIRSGTRAWQIAGKAG
jgi:hypothetical protein